ncbi:tRNA (cytidine(34)-2'-O)-methyltransferase [uncultured delta proteobacterium]|uniref:Putative tRNA (cytidine(34)-2'-O)-methyltransferase n=1 Tax=uncultured delta proteobacterium TaxID=34034 RepID=A0A212JDN9_9DELT|nr:tRNA (cytidine(34)-2'-O)-methyltransferase [uncultured delta proteobacterium]
MQLYFPQIRKECNYIFLKRRLWTNTASPLYDQPVHIPFTADGPAMHIVLFEPEIPPNTGNVARLCAATGTALHLIEPLGFSVEDRYLKRAGLDYWPHVAVKVWPCFAAYREHDGAGKRLVMTSSRGGTALHTFTYTPDDALVFGPETRGLPDHMLALSEHKVHIPIRGVVRSLNLSTAAGIILYQALASSGLLDADHELR